MCSSSSWSDRKDGSGCSEGWHWRFWQAPCCCPYDRPHTAQQTGGLPALELRVAALETKTTFLQTALNHEIANRIAAVNQEAANRTAGAAATLEAAKAYADAKAAALQTQVDSLQAQVNSLQTANAALHAALNQETADRRAADAALQVAFDNEAAARKQADADTLAAAKAYAEQQVAPLAAKLIFVSVSGDEMFITGTNLHIVNGMGSTETTNSLGNLIVGYNASRGGGFDDRTGSHNIIAGDKNNYSSYGGLVVGLENTISEGYASVSGGGGNIASGFTAAVSGGNSNTASGEVASVSGGIGNTASGLFASVSGGESNMASGSESSVSGGLQNTASNDHSSVSGGVSITQDAFGGWSGGSRTGSVVSGDFRSP